MANAPGATGGLTTTCVTSSSDGHSAAMLETHTTEKPGTLLAIPRTVERAAGDVVHQAFERLLSSGVEVKTAAEAKRVLADREDREQVTDAIQRFVAIATPALGSHFVVHGSRASRGCSLRPPPCRSE